MHRILWLCETLLVWAALMGVLAGSAQEAVVEQAPVWLVAGPLELPEQSNYSRAYYKTALDALPITWLDSAGAGAAVVTAWGTAQWQAVGAVAERPDFTALREHEHALYFARHCWVSPIEQEGELRVGSDDAVRVWLNGAIVFSWYYGRGYTPEENVAPVRLRAGTNEVMFALVNGLEAFDLGARMYAATEPLQDGLVLDVATPLQTGAWAQLDWYWMPAAGVRGKPRLTVYTNPPPCAAVCVRDSTGALLTNIMRPAMPLQLDLRAAPDGVYAIEARVNGNWQRRLFARLHELDATQAWWLHLLQRGHFFSTETLWQQMATMRTTADFVRLFSGTTVRAYHSRYTGGVEPYGISVPLKTDGQTAMPMIVHLAYYSPSITRETWSMGYLRPAARYRAMIGVWPYSVGNTLQRGLGERDVLDVVDEVCALYPVDRERIYLTGYSAGGGGCWRVAVRHPQRFAAIAPHVDYDCWGYANLRNVAVWQRVGALTPYAYVEDVITRLRGMDADARITIDAHRIKPLHYSSVWGTLEPWLMQHRAPAVPRDVIYTTWGDVDGAYWVRGVLPARFGQPAAIRATMISNDIIRVWTDNVACFRLDLRAPAFCAAPMWKIAVNNGGVTQAASGCDFYFGSRDNGAAISALTKRNGFCGGLADVVYHSFLFAAANPAAHATAQTMRDKLCGLDSGQIDAEIAVVNDRMLTAALCASNNVILCATAAAPGEFLTRHAAQLPFSLTDAGVVIGGRTGTQMVCVCPNPIASNRYLMTIMDVSPAPGLLQQARCDVLLDGMSGSFDAAWHTVLWDDEPADESACACGHEHQHAHEQPPASHETAAAQPGTPPKQAQWRARLARLPWGWIVPGAWLALLLGWGVMHLWQRNRSDAGRQRP
jgi:hypothetical protein